MAERRKLDDVLGPRFSRAEVAAHFGRDLLLLLKGSDI